MLPAFELVGWVATGVFAGSYLCREPQTLRKVQALAAVLWIGYGVVIHSFPIIISNVIVATLASVSAFRQGRPASAAYEPSRKASVLIESKRD